MKRWHYTILYKLFKCDQRLSAVAGYVPGPAVGPSWWEGASGIAAVMPQISRGLFCAVAGKRGRSRPCTALLGRDSSRWGVYVLRSTILVEEATWSTASACIVLVVCGKWMTSRSLSWHRGPSTQHVDSREPSCCILTIYYRLLWTTYVLDVTLWHCW